MTLESSFTSLWNQRSRCAGNRVHVRPEYADQWLRLWLLGGPSAPRSMGSKHRGKFENSVNYRALLLSAFTRAAERLAGDGIVYVRTDRRKTTSKVTREVLQEVFPRHRISRRLRPLKGVTQTRLFGHATPKEGEIDLILWRK